MTVDCVDIEALAEVLARPGSDPKRRHLDECARCSALVLQYQAFLEAGAIAGSDPAEADARLRAFVQSVVPSAGPPQPSPPRRFLSAVRAGMLRPAWVAAALVVVIAGTMWWRPWVEPQRVLRTAPRSSGIIALDAPQPVDEGGVRLSWQGVEGADAYQVRLYGADLAEIARLDPVSDTTLVVPRSALPDGRPTTLIWRVLALSEGDEIIASRPAFLELP
ncbi:MAG: hypothetical protein ACE5EO_11385 [Candidatus Krumholzibacteriia bacterium]